MPENKENNQNPRHTIRLLLRVSSTLPDVRLDLHFEGALTSSHRNTWCGQSSPVLLVFAVAVTCLIVV